MTEDERLRFIGVISGISIMFIGFLAMSFLSFYSAYQFANQGRSVMAFIDERDVIEMGSYNYYVKYNIAGATYREKISSNLRYAPGDSVEISYLPSEETSITFAVEKGVGTKEYVLVGTTFILLGIIVVALRNPEIFIRFPGGDVGR